jgi:hypothetical protein
LLSNGILAALFDMALLFQKLFPQSKSIFSRVGLLVADCNRVETCSVPGNDADQAQGGVNAGSLPINSTNLDRVSMRKVN